MSQRAFVIDQGRCIGCHACTVACKVEHGVEVGVFRTWVKSIEVGRFPDARRHFAVLRCNHCTRPPCVAICPVGALYRRDDGIVDFDSERCIGCKACLNACPYDALYLDPGSRTAAKCNFCAHRVELDLRPACEIVCPVGAIISGDLDEPGSPVRRVLDGVPATVRGSKPGTGPNVFYVAAEPAALDPLAAGGGLAFLTTEVPADQREKLRPLTDGAAATTSGNVAHPAPWGWKVSTYFLSKGVAAGALVLAPALSEIAVRGSGPDAVAAGALAVGGIAATGVLLVWDLGRPRRFYQLFTRPQWRSWLARGTYVLSGSALVSIVFTCAAAFGWRTTRDVVRWILPLAGMGLACYTAPLFHQCEGRELWRSPFLLAHTIAAAVLAGAGALGVLALIAAEPTALLRLLAGAILAGLTAVAGLVALDVVRGAATPRAQRATRNLIRDRYGRRFRTAGGLLGSAALLAGASVAKPTSALLAVAGAAAVAGLWLYEDAWVRAGQSVPLS